MKKKELIFAILKAQAERDGLLFMEGVLDILPEATAFCGRSTIFPPRRTSTSRLQIRRFDLRPGDLVSEGAPPKENERYFGLLHVEAVNGEDPNLAAERLHFPALTPLYPQKKLTLKPPDRLPPVSWI